MNNKIQRICLSLTFLLLLVLVYRKFYGKTIIEHADADADSYITDDTGIWSYIDTIDEQQPWVLASSLDIYTSSYICYN